MKPTIQVVSNDTDTNLDLGNIVSWCVTQTKSNEVLVASRQGLYVADAQGMAKYKVCEGKIQDVFLCSDDTAIAYDADSQSILTCQYNNNKWQCKPLFSLQDKTTRGSLHTLLSHNDIIYIASVVDNKIVCFNFRGEHIGTLSTVPGVAGIPAMSGPCICGVDSQGSIIICDHGHCRLLVYSTQSRAWTQYSLSGPPQDVIIADDGTVYVLYYKCCTTFYMIKKYTLKGQ